MAAPDLIATKPFPVREFMGVSIHGATMDDALGVCAECIETRTRLLIGVVNAAKVVKMNMRDDLKEAVDDADLTLADGMSVVWASKVLGKPLPERVAGIDLFENLLALANEKAYSVFLLGATQEVLDEVARLVGERYPNARLVGTRNGYFTENESESVANQIAAVSPDLLFVAMTSPKKEIFLSQWSGTMNIAVCHGVGGSFDVMAGKVERAPRIWQATGLEWLYRVKQEPRRLWKRYTVTNTLFLWMLLRERLFGPRRRPPAPPTTDREQRPTSEAA